MSSKEFTARDIRKIALDYIFSKDSSYKKLAEKYDFEILVRSLL